MNAITVSLPLSLGVSLATFYSGNCLPGVVLWGAGEQYVVFYYNSFVC